MTDNTDQIFKDSRSIVHGAKGADPTKKTVAMSCIRELEKRPGNVAAILPMLLEKYFEESPAEAVRKHAELCAMRHPLRTAAAWGAGSGAGVIALVAAVTRLLRLMAEGGA